MFSQTFNETLSQSRESEAATDGRRTDSLGAEPGGSSRRLDCSLGVGGGEEEAVKRRDCSHGPAAPVVDTSHQASRRAPTGRTRIALLRKPSMERCPRLQQ